LTENVTRMYSKGKLTSLLDRYIENEQYSTAIVSSIVVDTDWGTSWCATSHYETQLHHGKWSVRWASKSWRTL